VKGWRRGKREDVTIWSSAFARHEADILGYLRRRLPREDAEDLCQETFARAVVAGDALRERDRVRAYLFQIAHNLMVNHLRRRGLVWAESDLGESVDLENLLDTARDAGPEAERRWHALTARVAELLELLPDDQRHAFRQGVLERRPYAEIAAGTGWSVGKVKIEVFRARRALIEGLRDWQPDSASRASRATRRAGVQEVE
jgi:RNA polymerase sigma-70 factor, ECF subfamily